MEKSVSSSGIEETTVIQDVTQPTTQPMTQEAMLEPMVEKADAEVHKNHSSVTWDENLTQNIWDHLNLKEIDPKQMSPLVLAYIGDSIYDLVIRTYLMSKGNMPVNKINKHACQLVKAETQSELVGVLEPLLDQYEEAVYKRGRNAKSYTSAKNASISDYRRATGFEALMGYLYLSGRYDRMTELISQGLTEIGELK